MIPEIMKSCMEAQKAARESGKKGKELQEAIESTLGADQAAAFAKLTKARGEFQKKAIALLTEEQKANLPKQMKRGGGGKGNGKKKKDAA